MVNMSCFQTTWHVLIDAVLSDNIELVKHIIGDCTHYVDASWPQRNGSNPLYHAEHMDDGRLHRLVCRPESLLEGKYINPLLATAARDRSTDTLRWLLGAGFGIEEGLMVADIKVMPMAYKTHDLAIRAVDNALLSAIEGGVNGEIKAIQILLEHGVKVTLAAFKSGIRSRNLPLVQLLLRHGGHTFTTPGLLTAVQMCTFGKYGGTDRRESTLSCVSLLLEEGADANYDQDNVWRLALVRADLRLVQLLLDYGADPNTIFSNNRTALQLAFSGQSEQRAHCVKLLLDSGANPNKDIRKGKPLGQHALARRFPQYLGVTWDEMVAATEHVRHE